MAYDDSRFSGEAAYREDDQITTLGDGSARGAGTDFAQPTRSQLDNVFDDPMLGEPGRDRVAVHLLWETVLLLFSIAVVFLLYGKDASALRGSEPRTTLVLATVVGVLALGAGLALRAAVPNLAVGTMGVAAAMLFAKRADDPGTSLTTAALFTLAVAVAAGLALAAMVVGFHVPAWAASLGVALAIMVWLDKQGAARVGDGVYRPERHGLYWFLGFAGIAAVLGLLGLARPIRRNFGRFRSVADPAQRRGVAGGAVAVVALVGSSTLAAGAGILLALQTRPVPAGDSGIALTGLAIGAALLGGTSVYGRRGGVVGTPLAVALLVGLLQLGEAYKWNLSPLAVGAAAILAGLIVTRLVEAFGRPQSDPEPNLSDEHFDIDEWRDEASAQTVAAPATPSEGWASESRTGGWTTQLPANATGDGWGSDDRWGSRG